MFVVSSNAGDALTLLGIDSDEIQSLLRRTGYPLKQENGQRHYGPPGDWNAATPGRGCEIFVGKLPRDCFENELVPVFERFGRIYEVRNSVQLLCIRIITLSIKVHCVSKKLHPFYFCNNFVGPRPILIIFGRTVANEFYNLPTVTYLLLYFTTENQLKFC